MKTKPNATNNRSKKTNIKVVITDKGNLSVQTISNLGHGWTETNMVLIPKSKISEFIKKLNNL